MFRKSVDRRGTFPFWIGHMYTRVRIQYYIQYNYTNKLQYCWPFKTTGLPPQMSGISETGGNTKISETPLVITSHFLYDHIDKNPEYTTIMGIRDETRVPCILYNNK